MEEFQAARFRARGLRLSGPIDGLLLPLLPRRFVPPPRAWHAPVSAVRVQCDEHQLSQEAMTFGFLLTGVVGDTIELAGKLGYTDGSPGPRVATGSAVPSLLLH